MRMTDIIMSSLGNLWQRKLRTLLTMLGVVIGTAAIVVTISLGYGASEAITESMQNNTNLMLINVRPYNSYSNSDSSNSSGNRISKINDSVIERIRYIPGVDAVTPQVYFYTGMDTTLIAGKYQTYASLIGVFPEDFAKIAPIKEGRVPGNSTKKPEFMMSAMNMVEFRNPKDKNYEYIDVYSLVQAGQPIPLPDINWLKTTFTLEFTYTDYSNVTELNPDPEVRVIDYKAKMVGIIDIPKNDFTFSYGTYVNIKWLKQFVKENKKLLADAGGAPSFDTYDSLYVKATTVDDVPAVLEGLNELGVQYDSPMMWIEQMKESVNTTQTFLGAIGAISMLVAAISIANTMMMAIYERTREIGVMKVLGCKMSNIRLLFLSEAALIGFFGGALGLLASYGLGYALNNVPWLSNMITSALGSSMSGGSGGIRSVIPPELSLGAWAGVTAVSVASGILPASRAMQLSALEAIRTSN